MYTNENTSTIITPGSDFYIPNPVKEIPYRAYVAQFFFVTNAVSRSYEGVLKISMLDVTSYFDGMKCLEISLSPVVRGHVLVLSTH